ncbi:helix-turn-helix domain-containing protein [Heliophilum fasciatum]|uniref:Cytoskeletal protein RodZ n=1 Tax=Heliophilum fasciatum TaxID=35700 RepID=A0A4R2RQ83_9FIRM|nr:RodZ domain-containing protein [Heliophilum fasciatum]MCW2277873.1 cytoskeletal protein RodZ [Heliophilum fasciatum]TCP64557.1 cytoskeletal protein RodZ [Heliophilum fasciatum]
MSHLGAELKAARENRNMTLRQVENETNIRMQYLSALEEGRYDQLPGKVYALGFLRSYAKFLEVDDQALVDELKQFWHEEDEEIQTITQPVAPEVVSPISKGILRFAGYALVAVVCAGIVFFAAGRPKDTGAQPEVAKKITEEQKPKTNNSPIPAPTSPLIEQPSTPAVPSGENLSPASIIPTDQTVPPAPVGQPPASTTEPAPIANTVAVTLSIIQDRSWVAISEDGVLRFEGILNAGQQMSFLGKETVFVHVGNAGVVDVTYNGQNMGPLGRLNEVIRKEFVRS